jgi:acyl-CoA thioesterase II
VAASARGLARGEVFTAEGDLVCSVVQEGLIRTDPADSGPGPADSGPGPEGSGTRTNARSE